MLLHPAVRLVLLAVFAAAMPALPLVDLAAGCSILLLFHLLLGEHALLRVAQGWWRLRWLLLAILVLYAGDTTGEPWFDWAPGLSREGVSEAARRALVLMSLLAAVYLLLQTTPLPQLTAAILWLTRPLSWFGFPHRQLALRLALTLDNVSPAQQTLQQWRPRNAASLIDAAAAAIVHVERMQVTGNGDRPTPALLRPALWQWTLPLLLGSLLYGLLQ